MVNAQFWIFKITYAQNVRISDVIKFFCDRGHYGVIIFQNGEQPTVSQKVPQIF